MNKHFFRKTLVMLLLVSILVGAMVMPASAADSKMTIKYIFYGYEYLDFPVTYYDGTTATAHIAGMNIHYIDGKVAYCLEPQATSTANTIYSSFSNNDTTFWGKKISPAKQNAIMLAAAYGAPNKLTSSDAYTNYGYMAATQIVIWEIIMDYRSATPPYACTNSRLYNHLVKSSGGHAEDIQGMKDGYAAISASLAAHGKIPSFGKIAQSQAETKEMQYDSASGKYTLTLTDTNNVINNDFTFAGDGVTCSKSGNKLTITAPPSAVEGKTVMITGTGSNPDVSSLAPVVWGTSNSNGSRDQILMQYGKPDPVRVYFKVTAAKTSLDIVKQCSDGNVANITFTVTDSSGNTLFTGKTNSDGKLNVPNLTPGQKVTVTETVPNNYVADQRVQTITLAAGTNTLAFKNYPLYGSPFSLQKIDPSNTPLAGAVFQVDYYSAGWFDSSHHEKTWYFKTDANGYFTLTQQYLASGYTSDTLFPTNAIPLGIMRVKEIKAPDGFQLSNVTGVWRMKQRESGSSAVDSYWAASDGVTPTTSYGDAAYVLDADPSKLYVRNEPIPGTMTIQKTASDGDVEGYCFKLYKWTANKSWYGKSDTNGKVYVTDSSYSASVTKVYTFDGLTDGTYSFLEVLSQHGKENVWPENIRITIKKNGSTVFDKTYSGDSLTKDANGDCRLEKIAITGLSGGGVMSVTVKNKPITAPVEVIKTSADGVVQGISFKVEVQESGTWSLLGTFETDANGRIQIEPMPIGTKLRITEIVPEDYICLSQNPQTITLAETGNSVTFENKPISSLEIVKHSDDGNISNISFDVEQYEPEGGIGWWKMGTYKTDANGKFSIEGLDVGVNLRITEIVPEDYVVENRIQEITTVKGVNTVTFENHPIASLEIVKHSDDGNISNISFDVEQYEPEGGIGWWKMGTYKTDANGKFSIEGLDVGVKLRITEIVPENYECDNRVQEITTVKGKNTVSFQNHPIVNLELFKTSDDDNVSGIEFILEKKNGADYELVGSYLTDEDGAIFVPDLELGAEYRITETVPEGYVGENPVQEFTAQLGTNAVSFSNRLIRGNLLIVKLDRGTMSPLAGAGFVILNDAGEEIAREYTDENGEIYIEGLPYGQYSYQEFETPSGFALDETVYPFAIEEDGETISVEMKNEIIPGSISILKVDDNNRPLAGVVFCLEYSADNGANWAPVFFREADSAVIIGGCTTDGLNNGRLTTGADGKAEYTGLCIDTQLGTVLYRLTEVSTKEGYNLLSEPAFEGSLNPEETTEVELTVVNTPVFKMPATGGSGFSGTVMAMSLAGLAAAALLFALTKKKRRIE